MPLGHAFLMSWTTVFPPPNGLQVSKWKVAGGRWPHEKSPLRREETGSDGSKDARTCSGVGADSLRLSSPRPPGVLRGLRKLNDVCSAVLKSTQVSIGHWEVAIMAVSFSFFNKVVVEPLVSQPSSLSRALSPSTVNVSVFSNAVHMHTHAHVHTRTRAPWQPACGL